MDFGAFSGAILVAAFIYWGWDSAQQRRAAGAVLSTVILLATYAVVAVAVMSFAGPQELRGVGLMFMTQLRSTAFFTGRVLNRDTRCASSRPNSVQVLAQTLPGAPSIEQTVTPPMSIEALRETAAEGREQRDAP